MAKYRDIGGTTVKFKSGTEDYSYGSSGNGAEGSIYYNSANGKFEFVGLGTGAWSSGGNQILTSSWDNTAKIWDANTGNELMTLKGHDAAVTSVSYSADGKRIVTSGADGIVQIYTTDMDELLQIAESRVTRQLTAEEREYYGVLDLN